MAENSLFHRTTALETGQNTGGKNMIYQHVLQTVQRTSMKGSQVFLHFLGGTPENCFCF